MKYLALVLILVSSSAFGVEKPKEGDIIQCGNGYDACIYHEQMPLVLQGRTYSGTTWVNNPAEIKMDMVVIDRSEKIMLYRGVKECQAAASSLLGSSDVKTALCFK